MSGNRKSTLQRRLEAAAEQGTEQVQTVTIPATDYSALLQLKENAAVLTERVMRAGDLYRSHMQTLVISYGVPADVAHKLDVEFRTSMGIALGVEV